MHAIMKRVAYVIAPPIIVGICFQLKPSDHVDPDAIHLTKNGPRFDQLARQAKRHPTRLALPSVQQLQRELAFAEKSKQAFHSLKGKEFDAFVDLVAEMPVEFIGVLSSELTEFFANDDEAAQEWLFALTDGLAAQGAQERALDLTSYLQTEDKVPDVERKILYEWTKTSPEAVFDLYGRLAKDEQFIDGRQSAILTSLYFNEYADQADSLINWVDQLSDPAHQPLQALLLEKMSTLAPRESPIRDRVISLLEQELPTNPKLANRLPEIARNYSPDDHQKSLEWISSLETSDQEMRQHAFAEVMQEMVLNDKERATEILSSEHFLTNYYLSPDHDSASLEDGSLRPEAQQFYDEVLGAFMQGILSIDPQIVIDSSDSFFSPETGARFRQQAQDFISEVSSEQELGPRHVCTSPNCTNPNH